MHFKRLAYAAQQQCRPNPVLASARLQCLIELRPANVRAQHGLAQTIQQNKAQCPVPGLLVHAHELDVAIGRPGRTTGGQPGCTNNVLYPVHGIRLQHAKEERQVGRDHHARRYRFAMQPLAVAQPCFDGVAEGVAEVEQRALALLALVGASGPVLFGWLAVSLLLSTIVAVVYSYRVWRDDPDRQPADVRMNR